MKPSTALSKYIDELITKTPELSAIASGEKQLTWEDGTAVRRLTKYEETVRIVTAIREVYDSLDGNCQQFMQVYYWRPDRLTLDRASVEVNSSRRTVIKWKDDIVSAVAKRLGWL
ncbi:hypothetical protein ACTL32_09480 [Planococcus sp. FY231025]|uniref:hypothetical protein n=1 Tax=Planococcus sp. FY231025 TaxID=3455699 RepID=UPI003F8DF6FF